MRILIVVGIFILSVFFNSASSAEQTVRLTNTEWPPYFSEKLKYYGVGSRIVSEAFALEGIQVEYQFLPPKRALWLAEEGKEWDGTVGWEINPERELHFWVSDPIWEAPWVFFHLKSYSFDWKTFDDLKDIRIGGTLEYMYTSEFMNADRLMTINVDRGTSDEIGFKKLLTGRIDLFPQLIDVGDYQLQEFFNPQTVQLFTHHPTPFGKHTDRLLMSKKNERSKDLIEAFNRGLKKLKESGQYDQYFEESRRGDYKK
jgi:polar amino acid transport system substrate-binding protein